MNLKDFTAEKANDNWWAMNNLFHSLPCTIYKLRKRYLSYFSYCFTVNEVLYRLPQSDETQWWDYYEFIVLVLFIIRNRLYRKNNNYFFRYAWLVYDSSIYKCSIR